MLSDEQFIDQLRAELHAGMEVLKPSRGLLGAVEELTPENGLPHGSFQRPAGRDQRRRRGRVRGLGAAVPALAAVIVVVVVGAVALTSLRSHQSSTPAGPGIASSAASSHQDLLRTLGILRTAPTATERALAACIERSARLQRCLRAVPPTVEAFEHPARFPVGVRASLLAGLRYPSVDLALIRSASMAGSADDVTIFPASWRSSAPSAPRTWGVVVNLVHNNLEELDVDPTSVSALRAHGIVLLPSAPDHGQPTGLTVHDGAVVVPDGVAKVTVGTAIPATGSVTSANAGYGSPVRENVTAVVHDNVATVPLRTPTFTTGFGFQGGSVLQMTWLDAHGKVIRHTTTAFALADTGPAAGSPQ